MSWNDLGPDGGKALLDGIQMNHSLIDCQLSGNRIAEDTLHAIAYVLRRNRTSAPLSAVAYKENAQATTGYSAPAQSTSRDLDLTGGALPAAGATQPPAAGGKDGLTVKADLETEIYKVKRKQEEQEEENQRLRTYLSRCKEDLDKALR